jgi:hypothetical protein
MSDNADHQASSGIGIGGLLGVVFVTLKLCGVIGWSWWWVTCPFWGPLALVLASGILILVMTAIASLMK